MRTARSLLSPEARLVLQATDGDRDASSGAVESVEWMSLLSIAERERAALPLWRSVRASLPEASGEEAGALKRMAQIWEFKLIHLERLLLELLGAYQEAGIQPILLKGAAAALSIYPGFTRRPMLDLDLLVEEREAETAWSLARSLGWRWDATSFPLHAYQDAHHLPPLRDAFGSGSGLEIHSRLLLPGHPFLFDEEQLRAGAVEIDINGRRCRVPEIHHQLLHCCIHFAWSHRMTSHAWRAFSDVRACIAADGFDWDRFLDMARASRADSCCYWTLRLAEGAAEVPIPAEVLRALRPHSPALLLNALERHYLMNLLPGRESGLSTGLSRRLWQLGVQRGSGEGGIELPSDPEPMSLGRKLAYHWNRLPDWTRYLKRMLGGGSTVVALTLLSL